MEVRSEHDIEVKCKQQNHQVSIDVFVEVKHHRQRK